MYDWFIIEGRDYFSVAIDRKVSVIHTKTHKTMLFIFILQTDTHIDKCKETVTLLMHMN